MCAFEKYFRLSSKSFKVNLEILIPYRILGIREKKKIKECYEKQRDYNEKVGASRGGN
jgi:hypothetical protein